HNIMAESGKSLCDFFHALHTIRVKQRAICILFAESDAQLAGFALYLFEIGALRRRRHVGVAWLCALRSVEHCSTVAHAAGDDMFMAEAAQHIAVVRRERGARA